jgi:hypothetical protein
VISIFIKLEQAGRQLTKQNSCHRPIVNRHLRDMPTGNELLLNQVDFHPDCENHLVLKNPFDTQSCPAIMRALNSLRILIAMDYVQSFRI